TDQADLLRPFYEKVIGWKPSGIPMGEYEDYVMSSPEDEMAKAGICHHAGPNQGIPPFWIVYINVANLDESMQYVTALGGAVVHGPRDAGPSGRFCIIRDPAGAFCGLFEH